MADKIVAEYIVKTDKAVAELNRVVGRLDAIDKERKQTQDGFKDMSKGMAADFKKVGAAIGLAFGAQELISFGKEAVKLASQMEGVERAFRRIGGANSDQLLQGLRNATRGTVSDLQLMQKAVQASNFKIPLENLASLFKFAQARARETGESVEYLTNSIVLGIGRKSPLILDNLGISAVQLRERLKGVGVEASSVGDIAKIIGEIAEEELAKMGNQADTTADKIAQMNVVLENAKVLIGEGLIDAADAYLAKLDPIAEESKQAADSILDLAENTGYLDAIMKVGGEALDFATKKYRDIYDSIILAAKGTNVFVREAEEAAFRLTLSNEELIEFNKLGEQAKDIMVRRWMAQEGLNESMEDYLDIQAHVNLNEEQSNSTQENTIRNLSFLNAEIKRLQKERQESNTTLARTAEINRELKKLEEERIILLGGMTQAMKDAAKAAEKLNEALIPDQDEDGSQEAAIQRNLDFLNRAFPQATESAVDYADELWKRHYDNLMMAQDEAFEHDKELREAQIEDQRAYFEGILSAWQSLTSTVSSLISAQYDRELALLRGKLDSEQITREEYDRKRAALSREQFKKQKEFAIIQASINTALGVTNAIATAPNIVVGLILAAVAAAAGAAEIAVIASQPTPKFAEGGYVNEYGQFVGRKHSQGGITIEAEGGEFITSAKHAKQNADILKAINSGEWERYKMENIIAPAINQVLEGGFQGMGASYMLNTNWTDRNLLKQGDRNRYAMRDGFVYLGRKIDGLKPRKDRYASS